MLAIGRALMSRPKLIMMDEPSLGLAPIVVQGVFDIIKEINKQGVTILLVEQNANMALKAAHRAYVMETGQITLSGAGKELAENEDVKKQKHLAEMAKIEEISKKYKKPFLFELFKEFEEKKTKESLFANLVDKIDAQNHMIQNKCAGLATEADFDFIIHFSDKFIVHFPQLEMVEKEIQKRLKKYKNEFLKRK